MTLLLKGRFFIFVQNGVYNTNYTNEMSKCLIWNETVSFMIKNKGFSVLGFDLLRRAEYSSFLWSVFKYNCFRK